jgi:hypothetical protein
MHDHALHEGDVGGSDGWDGGVGVGGEMRCGLAGGSGLDDDWLLGARVCRGEEKQRDDRTETGRGEP